MRNRSAIYLKVQDPRRCRRVKRVPIRVWQGHFWRKPIISVPPHPPLESHPNRLQQTNMIETSKDPNTRKRMLHCALRVLAIGSFSWSVACFGAVVNVNIVNFAFSPSSVNISVNDSVTWTWVG